MSQITEIAVIGAGHAGIEAALAAAKLGVPTVLFTMSLDGIANMPCNPSIGGTGKGHLVYEIDALGGEMGRVADLVTLQSRTLNLGKGAAVHSKRIQADRRKYQAIMKNLLEKTENLRLVQAEIVEIGTQHGAVSFVKTRLGEVWECKCAIICTGTFLNARIFVGNINYPSGPDGMVAANGLTESLKNLGIEIMRFKTGTPARVKKSSIDFSALEVQDGENPIIPYSVRTPDNFFENAAQIPCHIVYTNLETHRIIKENITRSAMYSGEIHGTGARYCPSIEDKITRFADKSRHQIFIEPIGADTEEMYIQGLSTSLPVDVQHRILATLDGFENAEIMRYAYAIEYDCADPSQMSATLEFKQIGGLYGAGQFNGTSGYEEAAAQGLVAGINAALKIKGEPPLILHRSGSYIGTLIDDLVTKGTNEPYRIMTSRSEYRLILRQDNADARLTPEGYRVGLIGKEAYKRFLAKQKSINDEISRLENTHISADKINALFETLGFPPVAGAFSLAALLKRPEISYKMLASVDSARPEMPFSAVSSVEVSIKYEGYIKRQLTEVDRHARLEKKLLPPSLDYSAIKGLRIEAAQKLDKIKPMTIGQASRISGVNPADISVLLIYLGI